LSLEANPSRLNLLMSDDLDDFFNEITVWCKDDEELEELQEAIRADMRKGNLTNGQLLLEEIRARKATKH